MRFTIKDVAKKANVSVSTVSHALNKTRYVKEETRKKILETANELQYRPSTIARGLRKKSLKTVSVFVPNISSQFFSQILIGINEVALQNNYHIIMASTFYDSEEEEKTLENLKNQFIDGALLVSGKNNAACIKKLKKENFPFVLIARDIDHEIPSILIDNFEATRNGVKYLSKMGHKSIGYVTMGFSGMKTVKDRFLGYKKGLEENNIKYDPGNVLVVDEIMIDEMEVSYRRCKNFFNKSNVPTAIMTATDNIAAGLYVALKENDLNIPDDVSVIGFDNLPISRFLDPPLTTIKQPKKMMGHKGMKVLLDLINKKKISDPIIKLKTKIIERDSVRSIV